MIVFYVQGGGLGHLSRTHKLIQHLKIEAKEVLIITPSKFTHFFKQYEFVLISWDSEPSVWSNTIIEQLSTRPIQAYYIDTFPLGIKGELIAVYKALPQLQFKYTCRILKWRKYLNAMPEAFSPHFCQTIVLEKVYEEHYEWLEETSEKVDTIQLEHPALKNHEPQINEPYALIIHSGSKDDVIALCEKVKIDIQHADLTIVVFTQISFEFEDERFQVRTKEYPVAQYFHHATHIYTAAGFNLIHELLPYQKKHTVYPVDRFYDDQFFRTQNRRFLLMK